MTDRELLEKAAKAAGIRLHVWGSPGQENFADMNAEGCKGGARWNPLTDDGDALRLAVRLRMQIRVEDYGGAARIDDGGWSQFEAHLHGGIESATRRAIVRAAAALAP